MQRLPRIVEILLFLALCALLALWATRILRGASIAVPPVATTTTDAAGGRVEAVLASARLFGSRPPGVLSDNVRALGVVADGAGRGSVIVSVDGQPAKVYRVGDTLDGRRVTAIRADEIELESNGARQTFRLPARVATAGVTVLGTGPAPTAYPGAVAPPSAPVVTPAVTSAATAPPDPPRRRQQRDDYPLPLPPGR
jgi:general secretion pathway protein C